MEAEVATKNDDSSFSEMKFLRATEGFSILDCFINESIRDDLGIFVILDRWKKYNAQWCYHLERMPEYRVPYKH